MKLYNASRSSASFRVRIALNLKGLAYDYIPVHLRHGGGEQFRESFRQINPQQLVPVLELDSQHRLSQSLAIIEYLDETVPEPPLLPVAPLDRARVRAMAQAIACDIHPLNNLRVLKYQQEQAGQTEDAVNNWVAHWIAAGFAALNEMLDAAETGKFCHGDQPGLADICLVPQVFNAQRFDCDLTPYVRLMQVHQNCMSLDSFKRAVPGAQPDFEPA